MNGSGDTSSTAATSLQDVFFELADNLCQKYPALTPFIVRKERFGEVVRLVTWINTNNLKKQGVNGKDKVWKDSKGNIHIKREAKNDNWW